MPVSHVMLSTVPYCEGNFKLRETSSANFCLAMRNDVRDEDNEVTCINGVQSVSVTVQGTKSPYQVKWCSTAGSVSESTSHYSA
jgi:hypothetical protein